MPGPTRNKESGTCHHCNALAEKELAWADECYVMHPTRLCERHYNMAITGLPAFGPEYEGDKECLWLAERSRINIEAMLREGLL